MSSLLGGKPKTTTTKINQQTRPWFPDYLPPEFESMVQKASALMDKPYEAYTGDRVAGFSPDEMNSFQMVRDLIGQGPVDLSYSQGISQEVANRGLNGFSQGTIDQYMNPYIQNVMDISRGRQLDEFQRQKNSLSSQQAATGAFGGSRSALAQDQLYDNFSRNLAENETNQLYSGYNDAMNRAFQGTQLAGQAGMDWANQENQERQSGLQGITALQANGQAQRGLSQAQLDSQYQDWATEQAYPYQQLQYGMSIINPIGALNAGSNMNGINTQTTSGGGSSLLGAALGVGSMMMGVPGLGAGLSGLGGSLAGSFGGMASSIGATGLGSFFNGIGQSALRPNTGFVGPMQPSFGFKQGGQVTTGNDLSSKINNFFGGLSSYREGGLVNASEPNADILDAIKRMFTHGPDGIENNPEDAFVGQNNKERSLSRDASRFDNMLQRYNSTGGLAGTLADAAGAFYDTDFGQWVDNNNSDAIGAVLSAAPLVGPAAMGAVKVAPYAARGLGAAYQAIKNSPRLADLAVRAGMFGTGMSMFNSGNKEDVASLSSPKTASDDPNDPTTAWATSMKDRLLDPNYNPPIKPEDAAALGLGGKLPFNQNANIDMTLPASEGFDGSLASLPSQRAASPSNPMFAPQQIGQRKSSPVDDFNTPLIAFGATLLGSDKNFFQALGEAGTAFTKEKQTKEDRVKEEAFKALEIMMAQRRLDLYGRQIGAQEAKVNDPFTRQLQRLKIKQMQQRVDQGGLPALTQKYFKDLRANDPRPGIENEQFQEAQRMALETLQAGGLTDTQPRDTMQNDPLSQLTDEELLSYLQ